MLAPRETYLGLQRFEWAIGATTVGLNALVNGFLPERLHVVASLGACAVVSALAVKAGADLDAQGLMPEDAPRGVVYGLAAAAPVAAAMCAGVCFERSRVFYREERIVNASPSRAAYEVFVRIPLGTALTEEVIFRGSLLGVLSRYHPRLVAAALSSVLFGLWHVAPAMRRLETTAAVSGRPWAQRAIWVAGSVGITSAAGLALSWLRYRSRSIVAPWLAHSAANAAGFAGGWMAAQISSQAAASEAQPGPVPLERCG